MSSAEHKELFALLKQMNRQQHSAMHKLLEAHGFPKSQPMIIHILEKKNGMTQVELAQKLEVTPATISAMLKRMERDELIYRKRSVEDARVTHVFLTDKGMEHCRIIEKIFNSVMQQCFKNFSNEDFEQAKHIFTKMIQNFKEI